MKKVFSILAFVVGGFSLGSCILSFLFPDMGDITVFQQFYLLDKMRGAYIIILLGAILWPSRRIEKSLEAIRTKLCGPPTDKAPPPPPKPAFTREVDGSTGNSNPNVPRYRGESGKEYWRRIEKFYEGKQRNW